MKITGLWKVTPIWADIARPLFQWYGHTPFDSAFFDWLVSNTSNLDKGAVFAFHGVNTNHCREKGQALKKDLLGMKKLAWDHVLSWQ